MQAAPFLCSERERRGQGGHGVRVWPATQSLLEGGDGRGADLCALGQRFLAEAATDAKLPKLATERTDLAGRGA
ncbi:MAG TPA: hypothetical protein VFG86_08225 [Chloroflexota bacterium]|nr:hypothetical protein [Chloroflexota bacterium]